MAQIIINNGDSGLVARNAINDNFTENYTAIALNTAKVPNATHVGDVTGSVALTISNRVVTNAKLDSIQSQRIKGRVTAGTDIVEDLTTTEVTSMLIEFTALLKGLAPASGGGSSNFLRADGAWSVPAGGAPALLFRVSGADTTSGFADDKLTNSFGLTKTILNPGANEELEFAIEQPYMRNHGSGTWSMSGAALNTNFIGANNLAIGSGAMDSPSAPSGANNIAIGEDSLTSINAADRNICIGGSSGTLITNGDDNVMIGHLSGASSIIGFRNIFLGSNSGYYETGDDKLFISSLTAAQQTDEATARTKALMYGVMSATTANQTLDLNATLTVNNNINIVSSVGGVFLSIDGTSQSGLKFKNTGVDQWQIDNIIANDSLRIRSLGTAGDRVRILQNGSVYIGKTTGVSIFGINGLPTSAAGLAAGDIWNNSGVLNIV